MYSFADLLKIVENEISSLNYDMEPKLLYEPISYILSIGGKRIRPVFTLMACNLYTDDISKAMQAALALETFHNFTLLHDDIMDNSSMRRHMPTVHTKWNSNVAILSGDAMSIKAYEHVANIDTPNLRSILKMFNKTAIEVCEGQQYDMDFESIEKVSVDQYLRMIELKTSVLIAACFNIGAVLGGASEKDSELLYELGRNVGLAFQLQDDFLDVYGDPDTFGKNIGTDILCNKKTFLLISALHLAKGETLDKLLGLLNNFQIKPEEKIREVTQIYNQLNVKDLSEKLINKYFEEAYSILSKLSVSDKTSELKMIVEKLQNRVK